jgi:hypothetical protein
MRERGILSPADRCALTLLSQEIKTLHEVGRAGAATDGEFRSVPTHPSGPQHSFPCSGPH